MPRRGRTLSVLSALVAATMALAPTVASAQYYGDPGRDDRGRGERDGRGDPRDRGDPGAGRGGAWHDHGGGYARGGFDGPDGAEGRGGGPDPRDRRGYPRGYDRQRCRDGSTGTILGAIAGGLLGNSVAGYGNRAAGTIIGGGAGALAGRAIGRGC